MPEVTAQRENVQNKIKGLWWSSGRGRWGYYRKLDKWGLLGIQETVVILSHSMPKDKLILYQFPPAFTCVKTAPQQICFGTALTRKSTWKSSTRVQYLYLQAVLAGGSSPWQWKEKSHCNVGHAGVANNSTERQVLAERYLHKNDSQAQRGCADSILGGFQDQKKT